MSRKVDFTIHICTSKELPDRFTEEDMLFSYNEGTHCINNDLEKLVGMLGETPFRCLCQQSFITLGHSEAGDEVVECRVCGSRDHDHDHNPGPPPDHSNDAETWSTFGEMLERRAEVARATDQPQFIGEQQEQKVVIHYDANVEEASGLFEGPTWDPLNTASSEQWADWSEGVPGMEDHKRHTIVDSAEIVLTKGTPEPDMAEYQSMYKDWANSVEVGALQRIVTGESSTWLERSLAQALVEKIRADMAPKTDSNNQQEKRNQ